MLINFFSPLTPSNWKLIKQKNPPEEDFLSIKNDKLLVFHHFENIVAKASKAETSIVE